MKKRYFQHSIFVPLFILILFGYQKKLRLAGSESMAPSKYNFPQFERIVIDSTFKGGYQISSADINGDGLADLIAISIELPEIYWYENPSWKKHVISRQNHDNIDLAPKDIDRDGDIDLAVASGFYLMQSSKGGYIHWLQNEGQGQSWKLHYIDSIPTSHRLRWADLDGDKKDELINLPIIGWGAKWPNYSPALEFTYFELPAEPENEQWTKHIIDTTMQLSHGLQVVQWDKDEQWDVLTASFEGVRLHQPSVTNGELRWKHTTLAKGEQRPKPYSGCSEVSLGFFQGDSKPFIATIEPWHGNKVVCYTPSTAGELWNREVIDTSFQDGHALLTGDLDRDGNDEIIAGHRGPDYNLYIYHFDHQAGKWIRQDLDKGGMSTAGLFTLDFDGDGYLDIAACGSATGNVVLYRNKGKNGDR